MIFVHLERLPLKINITISSKKTKLFSLRIMVLCPKSVCKLIQLRKKKILFLHKIEADVQRCSVKKVFLKILQNSQENIRARIFILINTALLKKRLWHRCFLVNFAKFLRTPSLQNNSGRHSFYHLQCIVYKDLTKLSTDFLQT